MSALQRADRILERKCRLRTIALLRWKPNRFLTAPAASHGGLPEQQKAAGSRNAEAMVADYEAMLKLIGPAHHELNRKVKICRRLGAQ